MSYFDPSPAPKKTDRKLTQTQKTKIKLAVGKCEFPRCSKGPHHVHHINGDRTDDSYSNLVVLCGSHHVEAEGDDINGSKIPKAYLKEIIRNRQDNIKTKIKNALVKKKTTRRKSNNNSIGFGGSSLRF